MAKYKVSWWERNWWEVIVDANSEEEAIALQQEWDDKICDNMRESDDSFIDSGDPIAELVIEEIPFDPAVNDSIKDIEEEEKAFPSDKE